MPSSPLGSTYGRTTSGVACHHRLWKAQTVKPRRVRHANITFGQHIRSNDVGRDMPVSPLGNTHGRKTSGVACHHHLWEAQTVERRRVWHAIITFGKQIRSNDVGRGLPALPMGSTHGQKTSGVACQHRLWAAHTVEIRRAWHAIIAFWQHTRSNDVGRGMTSPPLDGTRGQTTSGVALHHRP